MALVSSGAQIYVTGESGTSKLHFVARFNVPESLAACITR